MAVRMRASTSVLSIIRPEEKRKNNESRSFDTYAVAIQISCMYAFQCFHLRPGGTSSHDVRADSEACACATELD